MIRKKILPITESPSINSYVHHSYPLSIIESGNICSLQVSNSSLVDWEILKTDADVQYSQAKELLIINNLPERTDTSVTLKRECKEQDEILVKLNDVTLYDNLTYIRLSVGNQSQFDQEEDVFFRWNQYDITVAERLIAFEKHLYMYYHMRRNGNEIEVSTSLDKTTRYPVYKKSIKEDDDDDLSFFVQIYFGENYFQYWKNMNFIQLRYDEKDYNSVYLDYFMYPRKKSDASYQEFSLFLDTEYLELEDCLDAFNNVISFIRDSIDHGYYVNLCINEEFLPLRQDLEKKEYFHYNLIHGYDDDKKEIYGLGYNQSGKISSIPIAYDLLVREHLITRVVRYKKNIDTKKYEFSIDFVITYLVELLYGVDSSERFMGIIGKQPGIYGLKVFDELINTERGQELIVTDRRLSFVLYEHCLGMMERLTFLIRMGYVAEKRQDHLIALGKKMLNSSEVLKNRVVKNIFTQNMADRIMTQLSELYQLEKEFYTELIDVLTNS